MCSFLFFHPLLRGISFLNYSFLSSALFISFVRVALFARRFYFHSYQFLPRMAKQEYGDNIAYRAKVQTDITSEKKPNPGPRKFKISLLTFYSVERGKIQPNVHRTHSHPLEVNYLGLSCHAQMAEKESTRCFAVVLAVDLHKVVWIWFIILGIESDAIFEIKRGRGRDTDVSS